MIHRQRGAALIVSLIMLLLISLVAISSFRLNSGNLQIVRNSQQRAEGFAAAQSTIEKVISSTQFTATPANALPSPCNGVPNTRCVSVNGDTTIDITVVVSVTCESVQPIANSSLNLSLPNDEGCAIGANQTFGVVGSTSNASMCSNSVWDVAASSTDVTTQANYVIHEGAAVRVPATTSCP